MAINQAFKEKSKKCTNTQYIQTERKEVYITLWKVSLWHHFCNNLTGFQVSNFLKVTQNK